MTERGIAFIVAAALGLFALVVVVGYIRLLIRERKSQR